MSDTGILVSLEDEVAYRSNVVLDYTCRDFTAIRAQLVGLAKGLMPEWQTAGEASDFGTLLLELFSYMGDVMHYYIDRTASEAFLGTALRRQSILYIADMLGYRPIGQQAASVGLEFKRSAPFDPERPDPPVTLPVGTRIYNATDNADDLVVFELNQAVTLEPGQTIPDPKIINPPQLPVFATEGITVRDSLLGISKGAPNSEFRIQDKGVVFNTVSIRSSEGGQTLSWAFVTDLSLARPTQTAFTTFLDDTDYTHVVFGDNASGRIPPVNAELYVTYRFGRGARANDLGPGAVNTIASSTAPGVDLYDISVTNLASPLGGTDPETVDAMRQSIPRAAARIKSRAVTLNDYADLAMQVPGVAKSVSHGTVYTAVHVRIAPQEGKSDASYMQRLINDVEYYMKDKVIVGSTVYAEPVNVEELWMNTYIRVLVHVTEGFNRSSVHQQVESVIRQALHFNAVDFGTTVTIGKIYRAALAVQGVEWCELMWLDITPPNATQDKAMAVGIEPAGQQVNDLLTNELLIPRIEPTVTDPPAPEADFPGLSEAERTHDGLWIWAVGGVPGT